MFPPYVRFVFLYEGCDFRVEIEESHALCDLVLFLCCILCFMCSGKSLHVMYILPFGMLCLYALLC